MYDAHIVYLHESTYLVRGKLSGWLLAGWLGNERREMGNGHVLIFIALSRARFLHIVCLFTNESVSEFEFRYEYEWELMRIGEFDVVCPRIHNPKCLSRAASTCLPSEPTEIYLFALIITNMICLWPGSHEQFLCRRRSWPSTARAWLPRGFGVHLNPLGYVTYTYCSKGMVDVAEIFFCLACLCCGFCKLNARFLEGFSSKYWL